MNAHGGDDSVQAETSPQCSAGILLPLPKAARVVLAIGKEEGVLVVEAFQVAGNRCRVGLLGRLFRLDETAPGSGNDENQG